MQAEQAVHPIRDKLEQARLNEQESKLLFEQFQNEINEALGLSTNLATALGTLVMFGKIFFFIFFFMWIRWTLPRFRYDQLMRLGWKSLIPLAILNILITGVVMWMNGKLN